MTLSRDAARQTLIDVDRRLVAEGGLRDFARLAWRQVEPGRMLWNWHLDVIAEHLEAASSGEIRNLLICVPPGTMKTLLVSVMWPAWEWTTRPASKWIYSTYAQGLSDKSARHHRDVVASPWYQARWGETCSLPKEAVKQVRFFENNAHGFRLSTAVGAGVTGHHGNRLVFDDLVKAQDAEGRAAVDSRGVERANAFWFGTMATRQADPQTTVKVGIMQRLHLSDTAALCMDSGDYTSVVLPMEYNPRTRALFTRPVRLENGSEIEEDPREEPGELLWPDRYPAEDVAALRVSLGPLGAAAQLDQNPIPPGGAIFKTEDFTRRYTGAPPAGCRWAMFVDCSFEDERTAVDPDPVVAQVWAWTSGAFYLVDQVREKLDFTATVQALRDLRAKWPKVTAIHIEKKANGAAVIRTLRDEVAGVKAWPPKGEPMPGKVERANAVQPLMTSCHFPADAPWFLEYRAELLGFPLAKHDDQVDGTTMALLVMHQSKGRRYGESLARERAAG